MEIIQKICKATIEAHKLDQLTIDLLTLENKKLKRDETECRDLKTASNITRRPKGKSL